MCINRSADDLMSKKLSKLKINRDCKLSILLQDVQKPIYVGNIRININMQYIFKIMINS